MHGRANNPGCHASAMPVGRGRIVLIPNDSDTWRKGTERSIRFIGHARPTSNVNRATNEGQKVSSQVRRDRRRVAGGRNETKRIVPA